MESKILNMGLAFRSLVLHSDGRWTVQVRDADGAKHLVSGHTPQEALDKAYRWLPMTTPLTQRKGRTYEH